MEICQDGKRLEKKVQKKKTKTRQTKMNYNQFISPRKNAKSINKQEVIA